MRPQTEVDDAVKRDMATIAAAIYYAAQQRAASANRPSVKGQRVVGKCQDVCRVSSFMIAANEFVLFRVIRGSVLDRDESDPRINTKLRTNSESKSKLKLKAQIADTDHEVSLTTVRQPRLCRNRRTALRLGGARSAGGVLLILNGTSVYRCRVEEKREAENTTSYCAAGLTTSASSIRNGCAADRMPLVTDMALRK